MLANTLIAHYARWIEHLDGDAGDVGWITGVGAGAALLLRPWMGQWINRLGARNMWAIGYVLFAVGALGNLIIHELNWALYALRATFALGVAISFSSSLTYITQTTPTHRRTEAIGSLGIAGFLGMLIGPFAGDLILGAGDRDRVDFEMLFASAAIAVLIPAILLAFLHGTPPDAHTKRIRLADFVETVRRYWPGMIVAVHLMFGLCMTVPFVFLADYIDHESLAIPGVSVIGLFFLCYAGIGLSIRIFMRRFPDRFGRRKVLVAGLTFMVAGMLCFLLVDAPHSSRIIIPGLLCGIGHGLMFHTGTSLLIEPFPDEVRGTASALALMLLDFGMFAGGPILGQLANTFGYHAIFLFIPACGILIGTAYAWTTWLQPTLSASRADASSESTAPRSL